MGRYPANLIDWDRVRAEKDSGKLWPAISESIKVPLRSLARACKQCHGTTLGKWYAASSKSAADPLPSAPVPSPDTAPDPWVDRVHDAAKYLAPVSEIAELVDCTEVELHTRYHELTGRRLEDGLRQYYGASKLAVRKLQFKSMVGGSVSAAIWLGKQCLGQVEEGTSLYASPRAIVLIQPAGAEPLPEDSVRRKRSDGKPD